MRPIGVAVPSSFTPTLDPSLASSSATDFGRADAGRLRSSELSLDLLSDVRLRLLAKDDILFELWRPRRGVRSLLGLGTSCAIVLDYGRVV